MAIDPKYESLSKILSEKLFTIPPYQRAYSWGTTERKALFGDIEKLFKQSSKASQKSDRQHFMATIVCLKAAESEYITDTQFDRYDIVDGQQRLTTLVILLKAIAKALLTHDTAESKKAAEKLEELLVKEDNRSIILQTNHENETIFREYLQNGVIPLKDELNTSSQINLLRAFEECEKFVNKYNPSYEMLLALLLIIKSKLCFIFIALEDAGAVYTVFEVLNSRGLPVDWLDKCKSMLMGIAYEKYEGNVTAHETINKLHDYWSQIYRVIGFNDEIGDEIIRFASTLYSGDVRKRRHSEKEALELWGKTCNENPEKTIEVTSFILKIASELAGLKKNVRLKAVSEIAHARLLYIAIGLSTLTPSNKKMAFDLWERVTFRLFGLSDTQSKDSQGDYTQLACKVYTNSMTFAECCNELIKIGQKVDINEICTSEKWTRIWYSETDPQKAERARYFIHKYEEQLSKLANGAINTEAWEQIWNADANKTIEHIHPQGTLLMSWRNKISADQDIIDLHVHRIGNLMLLPPRVNSSCGRRAFAEKKEIYKKQLMRTANLVAAESDWTLAEIEKRENELIEFALIAWGDKIL